MLRRVFPLAISVIALMTASIGCGALEAMGERSLGYPPTPTAIRELVTRTVEATATAVMPTPAPPHTATPVPTLTPTPQPTSTPTPTPMPTPTPSPTSTWRDPVTTFINPSESLTTTPTPTPTPIPTPPVLDFTPIIASEAAWDCFASRKVPDSLSDNETACGWHRQFSEEPKRPENTYYSYQDGTAGNDAWTMERQLWMYDVLEEITSLTGMKFIDDKGQRKGALEMHLVTASGLQRHCSDDGG